ncbi:cytochrome b-c1 complex subunit 7 [Parasteatoda tepidariorum]|uniref:cytochrome b-c1 complex subunit 7 n=1 Tax=Parasteatoda tepidariorum TaxID=114398 RepID=UPI0039BD0F55
MAFRGFVQKYIATPGVKKWFFNKAGYQKYGLFRDDCIYETPVVKEAIRRLPQDVIDARVYRIQRAFQLTIQHDILPKDQWTKFEEDQNNHYLQPYIDEVQQIGSYYAT